jgi:hypothetical protein
LIYGLCCVQTKEREAAGDRRGGSVLRPSTDASICCELNQKKNIRGAPERGGGDRGEEEARGGLGSSDFEVLARSDGGLRR